ncbi:WAT1-related protein At3g30340-like [Cornus florida]|uniref:WAT1-related protein At3g30340-like n=1 Tax=Cornus florida TaxID=4283 RepID=UPI002898C3EC|nr:WAT1-related protein At3g30340-like [Cornus florida]
MSCYEQWKPVLAMVGVDFGLAVVNILLKKVLNQGINQLVIVTYRQSISAIFLIPVAYFMERKSRPKLTARILCYLFFSALVGATLTQYAFLVGLEYTSATFTCAFINIVPVNTFIMALPFGLEKVKMKSRNGIAKVLGTVVCIGGALLLTLYRGMPLMKARGGGGGGVSSSGGGGGVDENRKHATHSNSSHFNESERWSIGSIVLTAGSLMWSSWFLIQARIGKSYPCHYSTTAIMSSFSTLQSLFLTLIIHRNTSTWILKGSLEISSVIFAGMVGSGLCYVVMSWCVKQRGPVFTAAFSPFIQIFVAIFGISILHEQIHMGSVIGSILVITGLYILLWGKSDEAKHSTLKINGQPQHRVQDQNGDNCTTA